MTEANDDITIDVSDEDGVKLVKVSGEVDLATAPTLQAALDDAIASGGGNVVIDGSGIDFMDSSGLRVLLKARSAVTDSSGSLKLRNPSPATKRVLEVSGLGDTFPEG